MSCELIANGRRVGCGDDDICTSDKEIGVPKKRTIYEDVPYRNGSYDFSMLDGEIYFENRSLKYIFGILGSEEEVLQKISDLSTWLYGIQDTDIWDTDIPYWHFHGSCEKVSVKYDETGLSADLTAEFTVEPFLIADSLSEFQLVEGENYVLNKSRRARLFLHADEPATLIINDASQTESGDVWLDLFIESGQNEITLEGCESCLILWQECRL